MDDPEFVSVQLAACICHLSVKIHFPIGSKKADFLSVTFHIENLILCDLAGIPALPESKKKLFFWMQPFVELHNAADPFIAYGLHQKIHGPDLKKLDGILLPVRNKYDLCPFIGQLLPEHIPHCNPIRIPKLNIQKQKLEMDPRLLQPFRQLLPAEKYLSLQLYIFCPGIGKQVPFYLSAGSHIIIANCYHIHFSHPRPVHRFFIQQKGVQKPLPADRGFFPYLPEEACCNFNRLELTCRIFPESVSA